MVKKTLLFDVFDVLIQKIQTNSIGATALIKKVV